MIAILALGALSAMLAISLLTACAVAIRGMAAPSRATVGPPPPGIAARTVALPSGTGHALAGWFAPGRPGGGAALLLHGIRADRRVLASRMVLLAQSGMAVLAIDLSAHGESAGGTVTFGHREARDVVGAVAWLRDAAPGERIGGLGISLGGAALLLATRHTALDALVLESVFPDIRSAVSNRLRRMVGPAHRVLTPLFLLIGMGLTGLHPSRLRPIEALRLYSGPVLVVSGAADPDTTPDETRAMFDAAPGPKQLWMVEGAGHVDMAVAAGSDYDERILAFLGLHLQRNVPCA